MSDTATRSPDNCPRRSQYATATLAQWVVVGQCLREDFESKTAPLMALLATIYPTIEAEHRPLSFSYHLDEGQKYHGLLRNMIDVYQSYFCLGPRLSLDDKKKLIQREAALIVYVRSLMDAKRLPETGNDAPYTLNMLTWLSRCFGSKETYEENQVPDDMQLALIAFHDHKDESDDEYARQPDIIDLYTFILAHIEQNPDCAASWLPAFERVLTQYNHTMAGYDKEEQIDFGYAIQIVSSLKSCLTPDELASAEVYLQDRAYSDMHITQMEISDTSLSRLVEHLMDLFEIRKTDDNREELLGASFRNIGAKLRIGLFRNWGEITEPSS